MKTLITLSLLICTTLVNVQAQTVQLQSYMNGTDWAESVLLNGNPLSESALNNFPIQSVDVLPGTNTIEFVSLPDVGVNGVSTLDIVLIQRQLIDIQPLDIDAIIPADIDQSGYLGVNDIATMRQLILGITSENNFAFVHSGIDLANLDPYDFGNGVYTLEFQGADLATTNFVFDVFVHGDVNKSSGFAPNNADVEVRESNAYLSLDDIEVSVGSTYQVPFSIQSDKLIEGFQIGAVIDGMTITDVVMESNNDNLKTNLTDDFARLNVISNDASNTVEGTFRITANRDGRLSDLMSQEQTFIDEIVYSDLSTGGIELEFRTASAIGDLSIEDVILSPNPAVQEVSITFPEINTSTTLYISNAQGQLLSTKTVTGTSATIHKDELKASGVYIVTVEQDGQRVQKKFVML